jgi:hypothetical protein
MAWPLVGWLALMLPLAAPPDGPADRAVVMSGKVVELSTVLKELGWSVDAGPIAGQVVLREASGAITPILSDEASRALFLDARLRERAIEVRGRRHEGFPYLQVVSFRVEEGGRLRTPEYYCEICSISVRYPQICPCCQGPMVLRMNPEEAR